MDISKYLEGKIASWFRGGTFPAAPTSLTFALSNGDPGYDGASINEPAASGYARQTIAFSAVTSDDEHSAMSNTGNIIFSPGSGQALGHVTHGCVFDNNGNVLFVAPLDNPTTYVTDQNASFAAGVLFVNLLPAFTQYLSEAILNWVRGNAMLAAPASLKMGLFLSDPGFAAQITNTPPAGDGVFFGGYEMKGVGYTRQRIAFAAPTQDGATGTTMMNTAPVLFGPAGQAWNAPGLPAVTHWGIFSDTGGMLVYGALTTPKIVAMGGGFGLETNALSIVIK